MPNNPLDLLWVSAGADSPVFTENQLAELPENFRTFLTKHKLLKQAQTAKSIECPACDEGHVEEVLHMVLPDGQRKFYIHCTESGCVQIEPRELLQWAPDYNVLANFLHNEMSCKGQVRALIPGKLWALGRAALAGQSREVFLARHICDEVKRKLPTGKQPILFIIFPSHSQTVPFDPDRTFQLSQLLTMDGNQIHFNIEAVKMQLGYIAENQPPTVKIKKRSKRATLIDQLKKAVIQEIYSRKSLLLNSWDCNLKPPTQKYFADMLNTNPSAINRALNDSDNELKVLWNILQDPEQIIKYS